MRFILVLLRHRLVEGCAIRPRIDAREHVAHLHRLPFRERHSLKNAFDARLDDYAVERLGGAETLQGDRHVLTDGPGYRDRHRRGTAPGGRGPFHAAVDIGADHSQEGHRHKRGHQRPLPHDFSERSHLMIVRISV